MPNAWEQGYCYQFPISFPKKNENFKRRNLVPFVTEWCWECQEFSVALNGL